MVGAEGATEVLRQLSIIPLRQKKPGDVRTLVGLPGPFPVLAIAGMGSGPRPPPPSSASASASPSSTTSLAERSRVAAAAGALALKSHRVREAVFFGTDPQATAEGAHLGLFVFDKTALRHSKAPKIITDPRNKTAGDGTAAGEDPGYDSQSEERERLFGAPVVRLSNTADSTARQAWERGTIIAKGQNLARLWADTPANLCTPYSFAHSVQREALDGCPGLTVSLHPYSWIEKTGMRAFLSVAKGSHEPPVFLDASYVGPGTSATETAPLFLIGKGITFDSGGINLKTSSRMGQMKGDMAGAAAVMATLITISKLRLPVHVRALAPLCENMPSGEALRPGDVITALNGLTIEVCELPSTNIASTTTQLV